MSGEQCLYKSPNHGVNLNNMRLNNEWCDLTIRVDEREYRAHKLILAANLKYFNMMFSKDSFQENKQEVVTMKGVKGSNFESIIAYAYTGEILITRDNALDMLELSDYLGEDGIESACIEILKKHEFAVQTYKVADAISCLSLKHAAKQIILSNFGNCSKTLDFLELDCHHLTIILSDGIDKPVGAQQQFFEGIMRWIMHDAKGRKKHLNDLLNAIEILKLTCDYLTGHLLRNVVDKNDEYGIMKDVIVCYHTNTKAQIEKVQEWIAEQTLLIAYCFEDVHEIEFYFQLCNLTKKEMSPLFAVSNSHDMDGVYDCAVLNNRLYFLSKDSEVFYLDMFDPGRNQISTVYSSSSFLSYSAMCVSSRFVYLCGGSSDTSDTSYTSDSNQVLRYDAVTNSVETLAPMRNKRCCARAIFYEGYLHVLGGLINDSDALNSVEKYDHNRNEWTAFPSLCVARWWHAVAVLHGKLYTCGGIDDNSVEVYDPLRNNWQLVARMNKIRSPCLVVAHEGKLFAIGGDIEQTVEVYDPNKDEWQMDHELSSRLQLMSCFGGFMSSSCIVDAL